MRFSVVKETEQTLQLQLERETENGVGVGGHLNPQISKTNELVMDNTVSNTEAANAFSVHNDISVK